MEHYRFTQLISALLEISVNNIAWIQSTPCVASHAHTPSGESKIVKHRSPHLPEKICQQLLEIDFASS